MKHKKIERNKGFINCNRTCFGRLNCLRSFNKQGRVQQSWFGINRVKSIFSNRESVIRTSGLAVLVLFALSLAAFALSGIFNAGAFYTFSGGKYDG